MGAAEGRGTPRRAPEVIPRVRARANAGHGGLHARRVPRGTPAAHAAARPDRTPPDRSDAKGGCRLPDSGSALARRVPQVSAIRP